jgi:hypothetical protein
LIGLVPLLLLEARNGSPPRAKKKVLAATTLNLQWTFGFLDGYSRGCYPILKTMAPQ